MEKAVSDLQHEMATIRTGRASLGILDHIRVDYYGTPTPLNQVANLHVPEPSLITIQPWDVSQIGPIEKAIRTSDLGLNPANDGKIIRLPIPPLTEERRKELVKRLHGVAEHHRVSVRNIRRDGNEAVKKLLKDKKITEDDEKKALDEIQKLTDGYMDKIDQAANGQRKGNHGDQVGQPPGWRRPRGAVRAIGKRDWSKDPGQYLFNPAFLLDFIVSAHRVERFQVSSTWPPDKDAFDLAAKGPPGGPKDQFREMMRNLLAGRFPHVAPAIPQDPCL